MLLILAIVFGVLALAAGLIGFVGFFSIIGVAVVISRLARLSFVVRRARDPLPGKRKASLFSLRGQLPAYSEVSRETSGWCPNA